MVEEGVWWRRACGRGGHVVEESMERRNHSQYVSGVECIGLRTEKEYVVKIFCLSDCQLYGNCFKSPDFSSHLCTYIYNFTDVA